LGGDSFGLFDVVRAAGALAYALRLLFEELQQLVIAKVASRTTTEEREDGTLVID
jgi:hypothetical protein